MKALGILSRIRDTRTNCLWGNHWTPLSYTKDTILLFLLLIKSEGKDQAYRPIPSIFLTRNSPADPLEQFAHRYFLRGLEQACVPALQPSQGWLCLATRGGGGPGSRPLPGIPEPRPVMGDLFSCWKIKASLWLVEDLGTSSCLSPPSQPPAPIPISASWGQPEKPPLRAADSMHANEKSSVFKC